MRQSAQCQRKRELRVVRHGAAILIEQFRGVAHMLRCFQMKLRRRRVMFYRDRSGTGYGSVRRCRRERRHVNVMCTCIMSLMDRMQRVPMGQHRLMRGVRKIFPRFEMPRCTVVKSRCLLVM